MSLHPSPSLAANALVLDGRFRVLAHLGGGGMGEVYLAEQVSLGRKVALKVLRQDVSRQPGMSERFRREARLLSAVDHPAVVRVIDFGQSEEATCLVMELAEGQTLQVVLTHGPLEVRRAARVLTQLAEGLAAIHAQGIIHRDLKPENVVLTQGARGEQARLLDFGIARLMETELAAGVSQIGVVIGTPEYLSPEQGLGAPLDARTDVYAFGVLAYRVLGGVLPFPGPRARDFLMQHIGTPPVPILEVAPRLADFPTLAALVMQCLDKDPRARPQSALEVAAMLEAATRSMLTPAPSGSLQAVTPIPLTHIIPSTLGASRTQNLTVMMTDIKGFTELTARQTRQENARMLADHDRMLLRVVRAFRGRLVHTRGDALLVTFESPTEAVTCGMAMQDRLHRYNRERDEAEQVHVRVALHAGEVRVVDDSIVGEPMQVVQAVEAEAEAGEVVFTESVRLAMNRAEAPCEPRGAIALPGHPTPLALYRCTAAPEGPPFGNRDIARIKPNRVGEVLEDTARFLRRRARRLGPGAEAVYRGVSGQVRPWLYLGLDAVRALPPRLRTGLALVVLTAAGFGLVIWLSETPNGRARALLAKGEADSALTMLDPALKDSVASPEVRRTRAAIHHAQGQHAKELALLKAPEVSRGAAADSLVLRGVLEDLGAAEDDGAETLMKGYLLTLEHKPLQVRTRAWAVDPALAQKNWGALRYEDLITDLEPAELGPAYARWLTHWVDSDDCHARTVTARRLGELGVKEARPGLKRLSVDSHRSHAFLNPDCGQQAARGALKVLARSPRD